MVTSVWIVIGLLFVAVITGTVTNSVSTSDFGIDASSTVAAVEGSYEWDVASNNYRAKMVAGLRDYNDVIACLKKPDSFGELCSTVTHGVMSADVAATYQEKLSDGGEALAIGVISVYFQYFHSYVDVQGCFYARISDNVHQATEAHRACHHTDRACRQIH